MNRRLAGLHALVCVLAASPALAMPYLVEDIEILGSNSVVARAIDNDGRILGSVTGIAEGDLFILDGDDIRFFSLPSNLMSNGAAFSPGTVNPFDFAADNTVVGAVFEESDSFEPPARGFRTQADDTSAIDLIDIGVTTTPPDVAITGVSPDGSVVAGWFRGDNDVDLNREPNAFLYDFTTDTLTMVEPFGESGAFVWGMNASGALVGNSPQGGFLWDAGVSTLLVGPGGDRLTADGISDSGIITGRNLDTGLPYVLEGGVTSTFSVPGARATLVGDVNDAGVVVGFYFDPDFSLRSFKATPIPEPASVVVALVSACGSIIAARRRA